MLYKNIIKQIEKIFFVIYKEKFYQEANENILDRFVCKHPLLRPEIIIINDQPEGFKKTSKKIASLEKFPIFIEIESTEYEEESILSNIELYSEININCQKYLSNMIYLSKIYNKTVSIDRLINIENAKHQTLTISSKLGSYVQDNSLIINEEESSQSNFSIYNTEKHKKTIQIFLQSFCHLVKTIDDIIIKKININEIDTIFNEK